MTVGQQAPKVNNNGSAKVTRHATLADVARLAGVVAMTASRALNQSGYVSQSVRQRVLKAAAELEYRPNMVARQLRSQRLSAIGILLPDIANPFSAELVNGAKQVFDEAGYSTFIALSSRSVEQETASLRAFVDHRVDGLIIATRGTKMGDEVLRNLVRQGIPTVTIGRPIKIAGMDSVTADHWQGAFDVVSHLISLGHSRIGFIGISYADRLTLRRYQGYAAALEEARIPITPSYTVGPPEAPAFASQEDGFDGMMRLANLRRPPTAVFARNDFAAIGALRAAQKLGLRVPEEIAIAGFDNIPLAAFTPIALTTVEQPIAQQGSAAAKFLLDRVEKRYEGKSRKLCMPCRLIVRESTTSHYS
ncbi:MAG TPA: LacI family DNA-binding transcriptional regulator [Candidatus Sulfotelmatobacter sp.]|jgi:DNA-binding LacI/PurR family transcriptional regulator|nr:LacI family DNA-binding transcriptional regulator [Candidatus Sulfotelmatobacter sp.]